MSCEINLAKQGNLSSLILLILIIKWKFFKNNE